jgi:hypothetical protein
MNDDLNSSGAYSCWSHSFAQGDYQDSLPTLQAVLCCEQATKPASAQPTGSKADTTQKPVSLGDLRHFVSICGKRQEWRNPTLQYLLFLLPLSPACPPMRRALEVVFIAICLFGPLEMASVAVDVTIVVGPETPRRASFVDAALVHHPPVH